MDTGHHVFKNKDVPDIPPKRAAYSDRTALLMAQMSKLAYFEFEQGKDSEAIAELDAALAISRTLRATRCHAPYS